MFSCMRCTLKLIYSSVDLTRRLTCNFRSGEARLARSLLETSGNERDKESYQVEAHVRRIPHIPYRIRSSFYIGFSFLSIKMFADLLFLHSQSFDSESSGPKSDLEQHRRLWDSKRAHENQMPTSRDSAHQHRQMVAGHRESQYRFLQTYYY